MERIWKEIVIAVARYVPEFCLDRIIKTTTTNPYIHSLG
jgi:hypothetical protein